MVGGDGGIVCYEGGVSVQSVQSALESIGQRTHVEIHPHKHHCG